MPTALVLLASEQLWPNIHSIEFWKEHLAGVFVYHTDDTRRSREPAEKLKRFCGERLGRAGPGLDAFVGLVSGDSTPQAVYRQIARWRAAYPNWDWVVNATGGTKAMSDGATAFRGQPGTRVVYRDLGLNTWYELGRLPDGTPTADPLTIPGDITDRISVRTLLGALWPTGGLELASEAEPLEELELPALTAELIARSGDWAAAFRAHGRTYCRMDRGTLFERYVGAGLLALGVTNLTHSATQRHGTSDVQEVDLVANYRSRILVFDLKLRTEDEEGREVEPIMAQIRAAADAAKSLGGLSARVLMVRPNRLFGAAEQELARARGVEYIDAAGTDGLFARVARFAGADLTPELEAVDRRWADECDRLKVFQPYPRDAAAAARATESTGILALDTLMSAWESTFGADWSVVRIRGNWYAVRYAGPASPEQLNELVGRFAQPGTVRRAAGGRAKTQFVAFETDGSASGGDGRWCAFLRSRLNLAKPRTLFGPAQSDESPGARPAGG
jgi:hypothetical protein